MKKIKLNCAATVEETFADFLTSRKAKGLADKTLQSIESEKRNSILKKTFLSLGRQ